MRCRSRWGCPAPPVSATSWSGLVLARPARDHPAGLRRAAEHGALVRVAPVPPLLLDLPPAADRTRADRPSCDGSSVSSRVLSEVLLVRSPLDPWRLLGPRPGLHRLYLWLSFGAEGAGWLLIATGCIGLVLRAAGAEARPRLLAFRRLVRHRRDRGPRRAPVAPDLDDPRPRADPFRGPGHRGHTLRPLLPPGCGEAPGRWGARFVRPFARRGDLAPGGPPGLSRQILGEAC